MHEIKVEVRCNNEIIALINVTPKYKDVIKWRDFYFELQKDNQGNYYIEVNDEYEEV
ncbi:MAG: hypothetical protein WC476_00785 [Phycisphaerae bacterium]|jgi:hypothetical protein